MNKNLLKHFYVIFLVWMGFSNVQAQLCGPNVPSFIVDLSNNPDSVWISPNIQRNDTCCGATAPDKCLEFELTLHPDAQGIVFNIHSGAVPPGALFYQIGCGSATPVGEPLCLSGTGPHIITFCKPGNNQNEYSITSISKPDVSDPIAVNEGCTGVMYATGYDAPTLTWTSVAPGVQGDYDSYMDCTSGCDTVNVQAQIGFPAYVDFEVCGLPIGGCVNDTICDTVRAYFNSTLAAQITPLNPTVCFGSAGTTITANGSGGTSPYNYQWSTGETTQSIFIGAGTYTLILGDTSGCPPTADTIVVTEFSVPISANAGPDQTICAADLFAPLSGTVTAATGGVWSGGNGSFSPHDSSLTAEYYPTAGEISAGSVELYLTTTGNGTCPADVDTIVISIEQFSSSMTLNTTDVNCFGADDGTAGVAVSGGTPPYIITWGTTPVQTGNLATGLVPGPYSVTVEDGNGCDASLGFSISEPTPLMTVIDSTNSLCGGSNGTSTVTPSGGTSPYSYLWDNGQVTATATGLPSGINSVTITDDNGCVLDTSTIINDIQPVVTITNVTHNVCYGDNAGSVTVGVTGGQTPYSYLWTGGQVTPTATGLSGGVYYVSVEDANGCQAFTFDHVNEPPPFFMTTDTTEVSCTGGNDGTATANVFGGNTPYYYQWDFAAGLQSTPTAGNLEAGVYGIVVTDDEGCTISASITVTQPLVMDFSTTFSEVTCFGGNDGNASATITGGITPYTYQWDASAGGQTTPTASGLASGGYDLTVTDYNGCLLYIFVSVTEPAALQVASISTTDVNCKGQSTGVISVNIAGGISPYTYQWSAGAAGQTSSTATGLPAATHSVTVTDDNGCTIVHSEVLTEPAFALSVSVASVTDVNCFGENTGAIDLSVTGGGSGYNYQWSNGASSEDLTAVSAGAYFVTVTDANSCSDIISTTVTQPSQSLSAVVTSVTDVGCFGENTGTIDLSVTGGTSGYGYQWSNGSNSEDLNSLPSGSYDVTVTDANGCTAVSGSAITQPSAALSVLTTVSDVICNGESSGTVDLAVSGGTPVYSYSWSNGSTTVNLVNVSAGNYAVTVTDANGCSITTSVIVDEPAPLVVSSISENDTICPGDMATISVQASGGNGGYSYDWDQGLGAGSSHQVNPSENTAYTVTITDSLGCTGVMATANVLMFKLEFDSLEVNSAGDICYGESTSVNSYYSAPYGTFTYTWSHGLGNGFGPYAVAPDETTTYTFSVTDGCNNTITKPVTVQVFPIPSIDVVPDTSEGCAPHSVTFQNTNNSNAVISSYQWYFGDGNSSSLPGPSYTYENDGFYSVSLSVTSTDGCSSSASNAAFVTVYPSPVASFTYSPQEVDIRNPEFQFTSTSTGADSFGWSFGDETGSSDENPVHLYPDTGSYFVNLEVSNEYGCTNEISEVVVVDPYYTIITPNAFTPNPSGPNGGAYSRSNPNNFVFFPITDYVVDYHLMIFNRWGELIFESVDIEIGWDGYYLGKMCQQDVYVWKIKATYADENQVTEVGDVTLLR